MRSGLSFANIFTIISTINNMAEHIGKYQKALLIVIYNFSSTEIVIK
ncbi:hypothetical protein C900_01532 [Fulvivirga imtechensis AK7]|uniref:Uncharacterized protein n=1 Tax=Fulvivirga imtechensis AK7 TaxID=1237149 RepID=L8JXT8_9BACT|nr:hypothetical protein C900_01532 [Fulvivirga imtechensis AK7]